MVWQKAKGDMGKRVGECVLERTFFPNQGKKLSITFSRKGVVDKRRGGVIRKRAKIHYLVKVGKVSDGWVNAGQNYNYERC